MDVSFMATLILALGGLICATYILKHPGLIMGRIGKHIFVAKRSYAKDAAIIVALNVLVTTSGPLIIYIISTYTSLNVAVVGFVLFGIIIGPALFLLAYRKLYIFKPATGKSIYIAPVLGFLFLFLLMPELASLGIIGIAIGMTFVLILLSQTFLLITGFKKIRSQSAA
jgi:hypothetical protein